MYIDSIADIERIFNPSDSAKDYDYGVDSKDEGDMLMERIVKTAEAFGIKPPKYQPERW